MGIINKPAGKPAQSPSKGTQTVKPVAKPALGKK
jgi:hypothetical protein